MENRKIKKELLNKYLGQEKELLLIDYNLN